MNSDLARMHGNLAPNLKTNASQSQLRHKISISNTVHCNSCENAPYFHTCQSFQLVPDSSPLLPFQWPLHLEKRFPRNPCCPTKMTFLLAIPQKDIVAQYSSVRPHPLWERCPRCSNGNLETRKTTSGMK